MKINSLLLLSALALTACHPGVPDDVQEMLSKTNNSHAFYSALEHYQYDSLKTEALYFVIRNLYGKGTLLYVQHDRNGKTIDHDWSQYSSYDQAVQEGQRLGISIHQQAAFADADSLQDDQLIDNIDGAFAAWKTRPWAHAISFEEFCNYILPYKDRREPLTEKFRDIVTARFVWVDSITDESNLRVAQQINDSLRADFDFNYNYVLAPPYPSLSQLHRLGKGPCPYMSSLAIYTLRGLGIPVTRDFVPYWTNIHHFSNHEWNAMLSNDGKWYGFMGCEANPGTYAPKFQAAKVFRETFANQPDELTSLVEDPRQLPEHLRRTNIIDVTDQYYPSADLRLDLPDSLQSNRVIFLAVYNRKQWRPVFWGKVDRDRAIFTKMAKGVVYLPMVGLSTGGYRPCMAPIFYDSAGTTHPIIAEHRLRQRIVLSSFGLGDLGSKDYVNPLRLHQKYTLFYWNGGDWQALETKTYSGTELVFEHVPEGALLSLGRDEEKQSGEQLFIFDPKTQKQVFW